MLQIAIIEHSNFWSWLHTIQVPKEHYHKSPPGGSTGAAISFGVGEMADMFDLDIIS